MAANQFLLSQLRHRIIIQAPEEVSNEEGEIITNWYNTLELFARVMPIGTNLSSEYHYLDQIMTANYYVFTLRYVKDIKYKMRINYNDRYFNIKRIINEQEENKTLKIIAQEELV